MIRLRNTLGMIAALLAAFVIHQHGVLAAILIVLAVAAAYGAHRVHVRARDRRMQPASWGSVIIESDDVADDTCTTDRFAAVAQQDPQPVRTRGRVTSNPQWDLPAEDYTIL